ncbi:unnamed protein product [Rhizoctonia solani]|uniref:Uncharacterized protein n=1 Tax=Rhizoctonia solani TaxID=456999 RepID=A0A8H3E5F5_9AGAM|nr:unnamed protein product [Rhizoctonia solani]CAE7214335.1 unnamed protein product [Rhizoctonia solani]
MKLTTAYTYTFLTTVVSNVLSLLAAKVFPFLPRSPLLVSLVISLAVPLTCYLYILFSVQRRIQLGHRDSPHGDASSDSPDTSKTIIASALLSSYIATIQRYYVLGLYAHGLLGHQGPFWARCIYTIGAFELLVVLSICMDIWNASAARSEVELLDKCEMGCQLYA